MNAPNAMENNRIAGNGETRLDRRVEGARAPHFMRLAPRIFIGTVLFLGAVSIASAPWHVASPWKFLCVLCAALIASGLKVRLPEIFGTLSVNYFFILFAITDMTSGEAIAIGCSSALVQCFWQPKKRVRFLQASFSTMNVALSVTVSYAFYHWPLVQKQSYGNLLALLVCSLLYFGMNTGGVAIVIALTECKSLVLTWRDCYFWSFPFYLAAASLDWIVRSLDVRTQWLNVLFLFPVIYVIYYSYRMYMDNLEARRKEIELAHALQKRTIEALEAAREASTLKSRFLAGMSHELRTPLNGIVGFAELLHDGVLGPVNEMQREALGDILSCSKHLRLLISHVLDLAKIEAGKMTFTYESVSLASLVREVIDTLQTIAKDKRIGIELQSDERVDSVLADAGRLKQILYNYLSNALKFTAAGGRVKVMVWAEDSETFRVDVEDSGVGISHEELSSLFSEFSQVGDTFKAKAGTGLGLAISRSIAEAQGGRVGVKSELGRGSTFFVVLPRGPKIAPEPEPAPEHAQPSQHSAEESTPGLGSALRFTAPVPARASERRGPAGAGDSGPVPGPSKRLRILLAEDNPVNQRLAQRLLERRGHIVTIAGDGLQALEAARQAGPFDLILMDVMMPTMDGLEATRAIRRLQSSELNAVPIIALTACAMKEDEERCLAAGMNGHISKPIVPAQLYATVENLVRTCSLTQLSG